MFLSILRQDIAAIHTDQRVLNAMGDNEQNERHAAGEVSAGTKKRRGYKPMQEGYQPSEERGVTAVEGDRPGRPDSDSLPKPPKGGTGESNGSSKQ